MVYEVEATTGVKLVRAGKKHAIQLGREMRAEDRAEVLASGGFTIPEKVVRASINASPEAWAAYFDGRLLAVFGVRPTPTCAIPWALTSVHVARYPFTFWKTSKMVVARWRDDYPLLANKVHASYGAALRWVKKLGFSVGVPEPFGVNGDLFCHVQLETRSIVCASR